jgi:hypothetical protein
MQPYDAQGDYNMYDPTKITEPGATAALPVDDGAQDSPFRRFTFNAVRVVETTEAAEITVIAKSEEEAYCKAEAQLNDEDDVEWVQEDYDQGEADLSLLSSGELSDDEIQELLEEQKAEEAAAEAAEQRATRRRDCDSILALLRTTRNEEERSGLIDDLELMLH